MTHHPRAGHDPVCRVTDPRRTTPVSDIGNGRHHTEATHMSAAAAQPDAGRTAGVNANVVLAIVAVAQFMVVLDASIVNVALPTIKRDVGFSQQSLSWILNAYTLIFGGFLLLGGRAADRLGRRRLFMAGIAPFSAASLLCRGSHSRG